MLSPGLITPHDGACPFHVLYPVLGESGRFFCGCGWLPCTRELVSIPPNIEEAFLWVSVKLYLLGILSLKNKTRKTQLTLSLLIKYKNPGLSNLYSL